MSFDVQYKNRVQSSHRMLPIVSSLIREQTKTLDNTSVLKILTSDSRQYY